jgi:general secretion pathway protein K
MPIISVLWGLGLLTMISVSLLWTATASQVLARNGLEVADINVSVEAAVNRAVLALLEPRAEQRWQANGNAQTFEFNATRMKISIQDELGLVDLNQADPAVLVSLIQAAGLDHQSAANLVDKILDWRDAAPFRRLNGAKDSDYRAAGRDYRPRNGPFQSVNELLLVMDMTPTLFRRVEPAVTVYSGRQFIDPAVAPREVLAALQNADSGSGDVLPTGPGQRAPTNLSGNMAQLRGRAFTIRIEFEKSGKPISHQVTVRLTENALQPFWILNWGIK